MSLLLKEMILKNECKLQEGQLGQVETKEWHRQEQEDHQMQKEGKHLIIEDL